MRRSICSSVMMPSGAKPLSASNREIALNKRVLKSASGTAGQYPAAVNSTCSLNSLVERQTHEGVFSLSVAGQLRLSGCRRQRRENERVADEPQQRE